MVNSKIIDCEIAYTKCFSKIEETKEVIRFSDEQLEDMYYHNYSYVKSDVNGEKLKKIIKDEINFRLKIKKDFCNIVLNSIIKGFDVEDIPYRDSITTIGYYVFDNSKLSKLKVRDEVVVKKINNKEMLKDNLYCDLKNCEEDGVDEEFSVKRAERRSEVYLSEEGVDSYICYYKEKPIGICDLFINKDVAKIEDFSIIKEYQRKGFGTTFIKSLIEIALNKNCTTCYVATYEDETAKEMYEKIGFNKIGEKNDLFFQLT